MSNYCIKVKRRGFNYYTDYMEQYFENVAVQYGYHLTKRREQAEFWCVTFIGDPSYGDSKWITFISSSFADIAYEKMDELSQHIGQCFKSECVIEAVDDSLFELSKAVKLFYEGKGNFKMTEEIMRKHGFPCCWYFSREFSAFDEPIIITEAETAFKVVQYDAQCVSNKKFGISVMNIGGVSKGLIINISFEQVNDIGIESPTLILFKKANDLKQISLDMIRVDTNNKTVFRAELPDFQIQGGFNEYSAKMRGKGKQNVANSCRLNLLFTPYGNDASLKSMEIEVIPSEYPTNKAVYKYRETAFRHLE